MRVSEVCLARLSLLVSGLLETGPAGGTYESQAYSNGSTETAMPFMWNNNRPCCSDPGAEGVETQISLEHPFYCHAELCGEALGCQLNVYESHGTPKEETIDDGSIDDGSSVKPWPNGTPSSS